MQFGIVKTISQIGVFLICAQAIVHFRPKAAYEKYIKMLVSIMLLVQLFMALSDLFTADGKAKIAESMQYFAESMDEAMQEALDTAFFGEGGTDFQITGTYPVVSEENVGRSEESPEISRVIVEIEPISSITVEQ